MRWLAWLFAAGLLLGGCTTLPTGPDVFVLPGTGKAFEEFQLDDALCRQWAAQQVGAKHAATGATTPGAGAAAASPETGATVGGGGGAVDGTAAGAGAEMSAEWRLQRRYDMAYMQCMYAKGNQIPVRQSPPPPPTAQQDSSPPAAVNVPPPPPGNPPPPPPTEY